MGARMERSEPPRGATWDDFEHVVELLGRQSRTATGIGVQAAFVRAAWELPSFEVGRDNWLAGMTAYAAVSPDGRFTLAAADDTEADALLQQAIARGRERGLVQLEVRPPRGDEVQLRLLDRNRF